MEKFSVEQIGELTKKAFTSTGFQGIINFPEELDDLGILMRLSTPKQKMLTLDIAVKIKAKNWLQEQVRNLYISYADLDMLPNDMRWGAFNVLKLYTEQLMLDISEIKKNNNSLFEDYQMPILEEKKSTHHEFGERYKIAGEAIEWHKGISLSFRGRNLFKKIFESHRNIECIGTTKERLLDHYESNPLKDAFVYYPGYYNPGSYSIKQDSKEAMARHRIAKLMKEKIKENGKGGNIKIAAKRASLWELLYIHFAHKAGRQRGITRQNYIKTQEGYLFKDWGNIKIIHPNEVDAFCPAAARDMQVISQREQEETEIFPIILIYKEEK